MEKAWGGAAKCGSGRGPPPRTAPRPARRSPKPPIGRRGGRVACGACESAQTSALCLSNVANVGTINALATTHNIYSVYYVTRHVACAPMGSWSTRHGESRRPILDPQRRRTGDAPLPFYARGEAGEGAGAAEVPSPLGAFRNRRVLISFSFRRHLALSHNRALWANNALPAGKDESRTALLCGEARQGGVVWRGSQQDCDPQRARGRLVLSLRDRP